MRGGGRTIPTLVAVALLVATTLITCRPTHAATPSLDALRARRAALSQQLDQLAPARDGASHALAAAQHSLSAVQEQILGTEAQLKKLNDRLAVLSARIQDDQRAGDVARHELSGMTRAAYESSSDNAFMDSLLSASSVGDAVERLKAEKHVSDKVTALVDEVNAKDRAVISERNDILASADRSSATENALSTQSDQLAQLVAARNAAYATASAPVQALVRQIHDIDQQLAAQVQNATDTVSGIVGAVAGGPTCGNHFAYGQCTYYVATRRCIPWTGNARDWFGNAARMGFAEGHTPAVGAVVAFQPGGDGASSAGHVGYVEAVGPAGGVPAGQFRMSEMNFAGWNRVSYRTLPGNSSGIQGFIYGQR